MDRARTAVREEETVHPRSLPAAARAKLRPEIVFLAFSLLREAVVFSSLSCLERDVPERKRFSHSILSADAVASAGFLRFFVTK